MDKQLDKLNNYVKNIDNSFYKEVLDYITDNSIEYTDLKDCIDIYLEYYWSYLNIRNKELSSLFLNMEECF